MSLLPQEFTLSNSEIKKKDGWNMNMIYASPLDCLECFLSVCVHAAVHQQAVRLEQESLHTNLQVHARPRGPASNWDS